MIGPQPLKNAILITGPTAGGKSALAIALARKMGGTVVNADSMQVYSVLRVITARPDDSDLAAAPHLHYGDVHPSIAWSTGQWLRHISGLIASGAFSQGPAVFVGGTGMYFRALLGGLAEMPDADPDLREKWRARLSEDGSAVLHAELEKIDPETAAGLRPGDGQRIVRALEIFESTGRPLRHWQRAAGRPLVDAGTAQRFVVDPGRDVTNARIATRFDNMVAGGALEEVRAILALRLDPALPAMRAIGVPELAAALAGRMSLDDAVERAKTATRQYAKRQRAWFRNQLGEDWMRLDSPAYERLVTNH